MSTAGSSTHDWLRDPGRPDGGRSLGPGVQPHPVDLAREPLPPPTVESAQADRLGLLGTGSARCPCSL